MDPITLSLLIGAVAAAGTGYAVAPPHEKALVFTRGVHGAAQGAVNGWHPIRGWRRGVRAARQARRDGTDPWSRIARRYRQVLEFGRAVKRGAVRAGDASVAGAYRAGRAWGWLNTSGARTSRWASNQAVRITDWIRVRLPGPQPAPEAPTPAAGPVATEPLASEGPRRVWGWAGEFHDDGYRGGYVDGDGNPLSNQEGADRLRTERDAADREAATQRFFHLRESGYDGWIDQDGHPLTDDEARQLWDSWRTDYEATSHASTTTTEKGNATMTDTTIPVTELDGLDAVEYEIRSAVPMLERLDEALTEIRDYAAGLADRWAGTEWGTRALDEVLSRAPEAAEALGSVEALLELMTATQKVVDEARGVGEVAAEQGAYGTTEAFTAR